MPRRRMTWFRFYVEAPADRKLRRMRPEHRWVWVCVLCAARQSPTPGELWVADGEPLTLDELADLAAVTVKTAAAAVDQMTALGLIAGTDPWTVPTWHDRQFESDSSTDRANASKQRRSNVATTLPATPQRRSRNGRSNAPETETDNRYFPPTPLLNPQPVDNTSHGHYPFTETPAQHPAITQLRNTLDNWPGTA